MSAHIDPPAPFDDDGLNSLLFNAWNTASSGRDPNVATRMPVPGEVALRGRFHYLADGGWRVVRPAELTIAWPRWLDQIDATRRGDAALTAHDCGAAGAAFNELLDLQEPERCRVPTVDALIGLADAARQDDEIDQAISTCESAIAIADEIGYRFGRVRAMTTLGYLMLRSASATRALAAFDDAGRLAGELDERLYLANTLIGRGEALARLKRHGEAKDALRSGLEQFERLQSRPGVANAAEQLGDLHRRLGESNEAIEMLTVAADVFTEIGQPIGAANAADGLGDSKRALGDIEGAVAAHARAFDVSTEHGYWRGEALARNGLGRCAVAVEEWAEAATLFESAAEIFTRLLDPTSLSNSLTGMALCAEAMGDWDLALHHRLGAVAAIESIRTAQGRHIEQWEYLGRFADVYWHGLRTAVGVADSNAFLSVFEALAGRRLAAMLASVPRNYAEAELLGQLLAQAKNRPSDGSDLSDDLDGQARRARLLGRFALRGALPELVEEQLDDVVTALVRPFDPLTSESIWSGLAPEVHVLLLTPVPGHSDRLAWCWRAPSAGFTLGVVDVEPETRALITTIMESGLRPDTTAGGLAPLSALIPEPLGAVLGVDDRLLLVPIGELWSMPWLAVPVTGTGRPLGEVAAVSFAPSASVAAALSSPAPLPRYASVTSWVGPRVVHHSLRAYEDSCAIVTRGATAEQARAAILTGGDDLVVVFAHGHPTDGIGHYLELGSNDLLTPMDLIGAHTPATLALISCWGAWTPSAGPGDPLSLGTLALVRGSNSVLATTAQLADDPAASAFVNDVLYFLTDRPPATAIRDATRRWLSRPGAREASVLYWCPLIAMGAW